tara:strand:- start:1017 stop:1385 length:369 start_codon:yes stop_codon:yes gene_type:complete
MYEETKGEEFGVDFDNVFEPKRGSKMAMAKKKNPIKQPTKAKMVEAIVNLEQGLDMIFAKLSGVDDALRQYIAYKKEGEKFQKYLDKIYEKRKEDAEKEAKKNASTDSKPKSSGRSTSTSKK